MPASSGAQHGLNMRFMPEKGVTSNHPRSLNGRQQNVGAKKAAAPPPGLTLVTSLCITTKRYKTVRIGGEGGIRTLGTIASTPDFESGTFDHSATSPNRTAIIALRLAFFVLTSQ
jgi:hypothetical protein